MTTEHNGPARDEDAIRQIRENPEGFFHGARPDTPPSCDSPGCGITAECWKCLPHWNKQRDRGNPTPGGPRFTYNESAAWLNVQAVPIDDTEPTGPQGDWRYRTTDQSPYLRYLMQWPNPFLPPLIPPPPRFRLTDHLLLCAALISLGAIVAAIILGAIR